MTDEIINWGVIGTGRIADSVSQAINYTDGAKLLAVASRNMSTAMEFADKHDIPRAYQGYEELCKDKDIDIVYIATPTSCHYENAMMCLEHGKNVLCEKSVTADSRQLSQIIGLAKEKDLFFMEAMWMKCLPSFRQALSWAKLGKIGNIRMIKADFSNIVQFDPKDRLFDKQLGASALLDMGVYPITLFEAFLGNTPSAVRSSLFVGRAGTDSDGQVTLEYENGAFAVTVFGYDIENNNNAVIVGDKGRIVFGDWFFCSGEVALYDDMAQLVEKKSFPHLCNGYEYEIMEACRCLHEGRKESWLVPLSDTEAVMDIMEKVLEQNGL